MFTSIGIGTLRESLVARLRSRGTDGLRLVEVARRSGIPIPVLESFLNGAQLAPVALAALAALPAPAVNAPTSGRRSGTERHFMVHARALKCTMVLDPAELAALPEPTTQRVTLRIQVDGRTVTADIAAKALRKARTTIAQAGAEGVAVMLQGRLAIDNALLEAGLSTQLKTPKNVTPPPNCG